MPDEQFFSLLTTVGAARLANAVALDQSVSVIELAVGDGEAEAYYTPVEAQTALKNEVYRGTINNKYVHSQNANWVVFELAIPADEGPFTIREAGIFDDAGNMIAVAKLPETYKPALAQGSGKDLLIKFTLQTSNAAQVELLVDPSVVLATHQKVADDIATHEDAADPHPPYTVPQATDSVVGKVELADVAEAKTGTDTTRAVTPAGLGSVIADYRLRDMIERLLSSIADSNTNPAMNAVPETYETTDGIDLGASSGISHDATKALISNSGETTTPSQASEWNGSTGSVIFDGDDLHFNSNDKAIRSNDSFTDDVSLDFKWSCDGNNPHIGFYNIDDDGSFSENSNSGGSILTASTLSGSLDAPHLNADNSTTAGVWYARTKLGTFTVADQDEISIYRVGSTIKVSKNGVDQYTFTTDNTEELRIMVTEGNTNKTDFDDISWTVPGDPVAMTEISNEVEAFAEPVAGYYLAFVEPVDAVVYGTDVTVDLSLDDGATWETTGVTKLAEATIDVAGAPTVVDIIYGEVEFATSGDQTMRRRLQAVADKLILVHASLFDAE